jgi:hypothetical protein
MASEYVRLARRAEAYGAPECAGERWVRAVAAMLAMLGGGS